jgi:hypothetical protein
MFLGTASALLLTLAIVIIPLDKSFGRTNTILVKSAAAAAGLSGVVLGHIWRPDALMVSLALLALIVGGYLSREDRTEA